MIKGVILAAGRGKRISACMNEKPKPLIPIFGKPLIEYPLKALRKNGVKECIVVVGYKAEKIREFLGNGEKYGVKIEYAYNPQYDDGNAVSLYQARNFLDEPFLVLMADHIVSPELVEKALKHVDDKPLLCVDYSPKYSPQLKDATKVLVDKKGYVQDIGKILSEWNAVDTGVFILNQKIFEAIEKIREEASVRATLSNSLKRMISDGVKLKTCDVSGIFWLDIDLPEDLEFAEKILAEMKTLA